MNATKTKPSALDAPMSVARLTAHMTPADEGIVAAAIDAVADLSDDAAFDGLSAALYSELMDLDPKDADRLAYSIIHECKRQ